MYQPVSKRGGSSGLPDTMCGCGYLIEELSGRKYTRNILRIHKTDLQELIILQPLKQSPGPPQLNLGRNIHFKTISDVVMKDN